MHRCNWTFSLVSRSSASSSSIFYVSWPAETSSWRHAGYDATSTTFSVTRPRKQRSCYTTSDDQCSHCSGMFAVNAWLVFISSLLDIYLVEEIHTWCVQSSYAHWKIHGELKLNFSAVYVFLPCVHNHCREMSFEIKVSFSFEENKRIFRTFSVLYNKILYTWWKESTV